MTLPGSRGHILDEGVVSNDPVHVTELAMSDEEEELDKETVGRKVCYALYKNALYRRMYLPPPTGC